MSITEQNSPAEAYRTRGEDLVARVKEVIHEGNVRRIIIRNEEGRILVEVPLTVGVVGAALAPALAAIGAIAALVTHCTLEVQRAGTHGVPTPVDPEEGKLDDLC